jgi:hypothetical protein
MGRALPFVCNRDAVDLRGAEGYIGRTIAARDEAARDHDAVEDPAIMQFNVTDLVAHTGFGLSREHGSPSRG